MIHLYTGNGKGKTTAAAGLCVRALGRGKRVLFAQFLKGRGSGELGSLRRLGATVMLAKTGEKFLFQMNGEERAATQKEHLAAFGEVRDKALCGRYDLAVLDEVVDAAVLGLIPLEGLLCLAKDCPPGMELVLTGHNPPEELAAICDYHTDFVCKSHPYSRGVTAREGIEY
ncbi:MAG: cob(I)yrinic acid a,c-diamide adenosyltransferase [Oscillospiraceae bacterium]|jgi:cob(I)alamin adenosyltransferase|nr:cob(I)yrinic acid a,c-diamide adenosyltransferase [Oscillospiraceae bacterium]